MIAWLVPLALAQEPVDRTVEEPTVEITDAHRAAAAETVVHEWGTFTSAHGPDGAAVPWRVLAGGEPLPAFVHEANEPGSRRDRVQEMPVTPCADKACWATVRMETPVLYFHAPAPARFRVQVDFPAGAITEWYPAVREATDTHLDWGWVGIEPDATDALPDLQASGAHYGAARAVDAALVRADDEVERFLFYRGLGDFAPPVRPQTDARTVTWNGEGARALIVYAHTPSQEGAVRLDGAGKVRLRRLRGGDARALLREALLAEGLFADEVDAMIATWASAWFAPGVRAFYVLPTADVDARLPLSLEPEPSVAIRVLVGRAELLGPSAVAEARALASSVPEGEREAVLTEAFGRMGGALGVLAGVLPRP